MKLKLVLVAAGMLVGVAAYADTLNNAAGFNQSSGAMSAFAMGTLGTCPGGVCTDGTPFWNNTSGDTVNASNLANVGNFLNANGSFTGGTNYVTTYGLNMYTQATNSPNYATAFSFTRQATALSITLLYANSSTNNNAEFGIYDASSQANALANHTIIQQGGVVNLNNIVGTPAANYNITDPYATWGIYARTCNANAATGACPGANVQTLFSNNAMDGVNGDTPAADAAALHMHWALFQSTTNAAIYFLALEDGVFTGVQTRNPIEGYGDYNDIILMINTSAAPEPATLSIMGLGLAGLGLLTRRKLKK